MEFGKRWRQRGERDKTASSVWFPVVQPPVLGVRFLKACTCTSPRAAQIMRDLDRSPVKEGWQGNRRYSAAEAEADPQANVPEARRKSETVTQKPKALSEGQNRALAMNIRSSTAVIRSSTKSISHINSLKLSYIILCLKFQFWEN